MEIFRSKAELIDYLSHQRKKGKLIGFVPTMGALHQGHLSLIEESKKKTEITVCSIYVNPTQFNAKTDLDNYPRNTEKDIEILRSIDCDVCFLPADEDVYPNGMNKSLKIDLHGLDKTMEGKHRPGHFDGVVTVVNNLFQIVTPDFAFFGEKDFQQLAVIRKMTKTLNLGTEIIGCPIVREKNGLAMSSRNERLSKEEREGASFLYTTLQAVKSQQSSTEEKKEWGIQQLTNNPLFTLDYFEIAEAESLKPVKHEKSSNQRAFVAVFIGNVRLIDNIEL
ncbi:MAG: pantoate--beta-alanine ligase [Flavobacteriales bacterium]|nr:pantoate--beta-alanine ligase [Flavobacteriales bacterium]